MFNVEISENCRKQFINLEKSAIDLLKLIYNEEYL